MAKINSDKKSIFAEQKEYLDAVRADKAKKKAAYKAMTRKEKRAYNRQQRSAWRREDRTEVELCKGARFSDEVYNISENRYYTLILKGLIVYLITAGGIGCYLTALEMDFNQPVFNVIILGTAVLCAVLYHSWRSENLGYLVFFVFYASALIMFKDYINSGFYAIVNKTQDAASIYFRTEGLQYYNERISNRYAAVTIAVILIGIAVNILLNNYILRRARYIIAIGITMTLNFLLMYMHKEPSALYEFMLISGIVLTYFLKSGNHYHLSRNDHIFKRNWRGLAYGLDWHSLLHVIVLGCVYVLLVVAVISAAFNKVAYVSSQPESEEKKISNEYVQNILMLGIGGIFNFYDNNGGLATGKLGGISSIQLDYRTDITVELTPYSPETVYINNFIGVTYKPYENVWIQPDDYYKVEEHNKNEADSLQAAFEAGKPYSAKGVMKIKNVEGDIRPFIPYYTNDRIKIMKRGEELTFTYYPREEGNDTAIDKDKENRESIEQYLTVPKSNIDIIAGFCKEAGFGGTKDEIVQQVTDYYQENIPYTIRPGATPWREDFINYFLTRNKKGYCAHFASAATLIFRYFGIPARYCEGYAIDFGQIMDMGEFVEGAEYKDYFSGYSELGETALVTVNATDADAHAWVEVYDEKYGWQVVEVTPSSGLEEEDYSSFWDSFNDIFGDGDDADGGGGGEIGERIGDFKFNDNILRVLAFITAGAIILGMLFFLGMRLKPTAVYYYRYGRADNTDKLILKYSRLISKAQRKDRDMAGCINYRTQLEHIFRRYNTGDISWDKDKLERILDKAGFSGKSLSEDEYRYADSFVSSVKIIKNKQGK